MRSVMERVNVILEAPHKSQAPVDHGVHARGNGQWRITGRACAALPFSF